MRYQADGRLDRSSVVVYEYEVAYAIHCSGQERDRVTIVDNISLGKACGSYDPEPARR